MMLPSAAPFWIPTSVGMGRSWIAASLLPHRFLINGVDSCYLLSQAQVPQE